LLGALWAVAPAFACQPPTDQAVYVIHHETYGDIGTHSLSFECVGNDLVVETNVEVKVKILFATVYQRRARYREIWQDDRLIAYDAWTDEAGDEYTTTARIDGNQMVINGLKPGVRVPPDTVSSHPWNIKVVKRPLLFGMKDGRLLRVKVEAIGDKPITVGGKTISARKFVVSGDIERELFYDAAGNWLQWRLRNKGKTVTITRR
jgi:hypothetical protein